MEEFGQVESQLHPKTMLKLLTGFYKQRGKLILNLKFSRISAYRELTLGIAIRKIQAH